MKARTILAAFVASSLLAVPAFAAPPNGKAPAAAHAKKKRAGKADPAKREARMLAKLKKAGVDEARAKKVVAINKRYHAAQKALRDASKTDRQAFRKLRRSDSKDAAAIKAAKEKMQAHRAKRKALNEKRAAEVRTVLTSAEAAKIKEMHHKARGDKKGKRGGNRGKAKGKQS